MFRCCLSKITGTKVVILSIFKQLSKGIPRYHRITQKRCAEDRFGTLWHSLCWLALTAGVHADKKTRSAQVPTFSTICLPRSTERNNHDAYFTMIPLVRHKHEKIQQRTANNSDSHSAQYVMDWSLQNAEVENVNLELENFSFSISISSILDMR